ncbi:hypothetical protein GUJ93_ZPchr0013g35042 [Zizania palustris]|uniref:Uncharacterized protein n=1 Tax=Zizania palustris TaxID=103762 RepID=A0A8J5X5D7_ZIZPA|nr:hypothetical protein GUJ93_ZPchr0013g35042 [Zizania palustris]
MPRNILVKTTHNMMHNVDWIENGIPYTEVMEVAAEAVRRSSMAFRRITFTATVACSSSLLFSPTAMRHGYCDRSKGHRGDAAKAEDDDAIQRCWTAGGEEHGRNSRLVTWH